ITALRFYKGAQNNGPHTASLWTATGSLLASVPFNGETTSGWQTVTLPNPVAITANTVYVASYHTSSGYARDVSYFTTGVYRGPLYALADGEGGGGQGVYLYSATTAFPTNTYSSPNYWVDVVFTPSPPPPPPPPTPLTITAITPDSVPSGGPGFALTVTGSNFASGASVLWNGVARTTTLGSELQVTAAITAADVAAPGAAQVTVSKPGNPISNGLPFTITTGPLTLSSLSPSSAQPGGPGFTLTVTGSNFASDATVQ